MTPPLVVHVVDHAYPELSGYSVRSHNLLRALQRRGVALLAVAPRCGEGPVGENDVDGVRYVHVPTGRDLATLAGHATGWRRFRAGLAEVIRARGARLVHAHSPARIGLAGLRAARATGLPFLYEWRGLWEDTAVDRGRSRVWSLRYQATRAAETAVLRGSDAVVTISRGLEQDARDRGVAASRLFRVPNGVDSGRFEPRPRDPVLAARLGLGDEFVVGFIGFFFAYEGVDLLLQAFREVVAALPRARLLLVGAGDLDARVRALAAAGGLGDRVVFAGRVAHAEIVAHYGLCDVLAYPRRRTRSTELVTPLKPLEAMAAGRPVVASAVGGLAELVDDGVTGLLCAPDDVGSLAAQLIRLGRDPGLCATLAANARAAAVARDWNEVSAGYAAPYATLLGAASAAAGARR